MMRVYKLISVCAGIMCLLASCGHGNKFVLKGTLGTEKGETFLAVYDDPIAKIDTIIPIEGEFEYTFIPDTMTLIRLVNNEGKIIPIFADKGWEVVCKGTFDKPVLSGEAHNKDYYEFLKSIEGIESTDSVAVVAEKFIRKHPHSFASAYLIDRFFTQTENPDMQMVNSLITPLNGEVKDSRVLNVAMKSIPTDKEKTHKTLNYFSLTDRKGKYISWSTKKEEYILVNFWASWDEKSKIASDSLYAQVKEFPKNRLKVFNISLDYDKKKWLNECKKDTTFWVEICNLQGWEAPIVKQNNILSLPFNILIDGQRQIHGYNLANTALSDTLKIKKETKKSGKKNGKKHR